MAQTDETHGPVSGMVVPRFAGIATFMRLPQRGDDLAGLDIGIAGVPWDGGTTNRPGARHGPRGVRDSSTLIRTMNQATGVRPFELATVADVGDTSVNPVDLEDTLGRVTDFFRRLKDAGVTPIAVGGDHLVSLPILRAVASDGPIGLVHFDAHNDTWDTYFDGYKYTHGTPFRRAVEENLLDPKRMVQIGLRGSLYGEAADNWGPEQGIREIPIEEVVERGLTDVMAEARRIVGDGAVYVTFDIDCLDPVYAPGTGTPEIGGFTTREAQAMVRSLSGLDIVAVDLVEVAPPFDVGSLTQIAAANILFELLCVTAEAVARRKT